MVCFPQPFAPMYTSSMTCSSVESFDNVDPCVGITSAAEHCRTRSALIDALFSCCLCYLRLRQRVEAARCLWTPTSALLLCYRHTPGAWIRPLHLHRSQNRV